MRPLARIALLLASLAAMLTSAGALAQRLPAQYLAGEAAFDKGNWSGAISQFHSAWNQRQYWQVAYYLGVSYCNRNLPGPPPSDAAAWLKKAGRMPGSDWNLISAASRDCTIDRPLRITRKITRTVIYAELLYFGANAKLRYHDLKSEGDFDLAALQKRIAPVGNAPALQDSAAALSKVLDGPGMVSRCTRAIPVRTYRRGRFLFVTRSSAQPFQLNEWGDVLEDYVQDLNRRFGVPVPGDMITIHMAACPEDMEKIAKALHGLKFDPIQAKGYSVPADMSLVALWDGSMPPRPGQRDNETMRTLRHEIAHLVLRSWFGDPPPWLDEGLAQYVGVTADNTIAGHTTVLHSTWGSLPDLAHVISNWEIDQGQNCVTVSLRMMEADVSRMFLAYIDEKPGRLGQLIAIFHEQDPVAEIPPSDRSLIERLLGESFDDIDVAYRASRHVYVDDTLFKAIAGDDCPV